MSCLSLSVSILTVLHFISNGCCWWNLGRCFLIGCFTSRHLSANHGAGSCRYCYRLHVETHSVILRKTEFQMSEQKQQIKVMSWCQQLNVMGSYTRNTRTDEYIRICLIHCICTVTFGFSCFTFSFCEAESK